MLNLSQEEKTILITFEAIERNFCQAISKKTIGVILYLSNILAPVFKTNYPYAKKINNKENSNIFVELNSHIDLLLHENLIEETLSENKVLKYRINRNGFCRLNLIKASEPEYSKIESLMSEIASSLSVLCENMIHNLYEIEFFKKSGVQTFEFDNKLNINEIVLQLYPEKRVDSPRESVHRYIEYHKELLLQKNVDTFQENT